MCPSFTVMNRTCAVYSYIILRTSSLENNAFSVMQYVEKVTLYYLMLHRFEFHSVFLPWNFRARLYYAAASQPRVFVRLLVGNHRDRPQHASWDGDCIMLCQYKYKLFCSKRIYLPTFFWSETLLGVNLPLARLSVRGYVCVSTRQQIFINFITPDDNRMIFTLRTTQASPVRKVLYGRRLPPIKSCRMTQTKHKMV